MRLIKQSFLSKASYYAAINHVTPSNLTYAWNFGSLAVLCLVVQILSGVFLAMHYTPHADLAFLSVEHIMRDVQGGWLVRYIHANGASMFFVVVYLHIFRGLYYTSYIWPRQFVWVFGVILLLLMIITAFLGFRDIAQNDLYFFTTLYTPQVLTFIKDKSLEPKFIYDKINPLNIGDIKDLLARETKGLAGVYLILNKLTFDYYIGSAPVDRLSNRFANHLINLTGNKMVKFSVKKNGIQNFAFLLLEVIPDKVGTNLELIELEEFYIEDLSPRYNFLTKSSEDYGYKYGEFNRMQFLTKYTQNRKDTRQELRLPQESIEKIRKSAEIVGKPILNERTLANIRSLRKIKFKTPDKVVYGDFPGYIEAAQFIGFDFKEVKKTLRTPKRVLKRSWILKV